jgi:large subunit ribosomal protein L9
MKIILTQPHAKLGAPGDIAIVKDGFARNFLFPRNLAIPASKGNLFQVEEIKKRQDTIEKKRKEKMLLLGEKLSRASVDLEVEVDEYDKLYGHVSAGQIAEALNNQGFDLDRKQIVIDEPINTLGVYNVKIRLHPEVETEVRVWIMKHSK